MTSEDGHLPAPPPVTEEFKQFAIPRLREQFEMLRDGDSELGRMVQHMVQNVTREDMMQTEFFLMELYGITQPEHIEMSKYVLNPVGDPPAAFFKTLEPVPIDEHFYEIALKHDMFSTQHRMNILMNVVEKQRLQAEVQERLEGQGE